MKNKRIAITKRDGSIEPFSLAKLRACLAAVMDAARQDPRLAEPLARAVQAHLREWREHRLPTTDYIYRCARTVLIQTNLQEAAETFAFHRRVRRERRRRLWVVEALTPPKGMTRWNKGALVATFQNRFGVRQSVARFLGGRVEQHVFSLNYQLVSRSFLAELVRNEVMAWGLLDEPAVAPAGAGASRPVKVPEHEK